MSYIRTIGVFLGAFGLGFGLAIPGHAQPQPKAEGIESEGYVWNEMMGEKVEALDLPGDVERGEEAYEVCGACHLPSGAGRPDGTFPQLAGQHTTVLIKQIADIREGRRDNPIMYPFAKTLVDPQELADVAAYVETLPIPRDNGKGPGTNLEEGEQLYQRDCVKCHQAHGEGDAAQFYPVLAGQHYKYLLRQIRDIARRLHVAARVARADGQGVAEAWTTRAGGSSREPGDSLP
jgi:cytochrome c553